MLKIATNTPYLFHQTSDYAFIQLGECPNEAAFILIMLEKNWGSGNIQKIKTLKHWISKYPVNTPCYLVGCEMTIPNEELTRFIDKNRDSAIRDLCDEILRRSNSIGVRGEITYSYLTEVLKYKPEQIDIIFSKNKAENKDRLDKYIQKKQ